MIFRFLKLNLLFCLLGFAGVCYAQSVSAEIDNIIYTSIDDVPGTCSVRSNSEFEEVDIPETIKMEGKTYTVTTLRSFYSVKVLNLPKTIISFDTENSGLWGGKIQYVTIASDNPLYISDKGAVYNKERDTLIYVSRGWAEYNGYTEPVVFNVPSTVKTLGIQCFRTCPNIKGINLPDGLTEIGRACFGGMNDLETLTIPSTVKELPENEINVFQGLLSNCRKLTEVKIRSSITKIPVATFMACDRLSTVNGIENVTEIQYFAFSGCALNNFTLPQEINIIGEGAFNKAGLECERFVIPSTVSEIGAGAFAQCKFKKVVIDALIDSIPQKCFYNCENLTEIKFSSSIKRIGNYAFNNSGIMKVILPDAMTELGREAFAKCGSLTFVATGNGLTEIPNTTFSESNQISEVILGTNIKEIAARRAFKTDNLTKLTCLSLNPPIVKYAFTQANYETVHLSVPAEALEEYKNTDPWNKFLNITGDASWSGIESSIIDRHIPIVHVVAGSIYVTGVADGTVVRVCNLAGMTVATKIVSQGTCTINIPSGLYIVTTPSAAIKVIVY